MKRAYVFLNGELLGKKEFYTEYISSNCGDIFCGDGGYNHLKTLSFTPLEIWGDMDSIDKKDLETLEKSNYIILKKFPRDKNFTDGELLINYLVQLNYSEIVLIGGLGGRKSHELTNLNLFGKYPNLIFLTEYEKIIYIDKNTVLENMKDLKISLIPLAGKVESLTLTGFQYNLENYSLNLGDSRCISNKIIENSSKITYSNGVLLGIFEKS